MQTLDGYWLSDQFCITASFEAGLFLIYTITHAYNILELYSYRLGILKMCLYVTKNRCVCFPPVYNEQLF